MSEKYRPSSTELSGSLVEKNKLKGTLIEKGKLRGSLVEKKEIDTEVKEGMIVVYTESGKDFRVHSVKEEIDKVYLEAVEGKARGGSYSLRLSEFREKLKTKGSPWRVR